MLEIKQTDTYRKWERKLRDQRGRALIAARVFRLANGLPGNEIIILLCGGDKDTQQSDIDTAKRLAEGWEAS